MTSPNSGSYVPKPGTGGCRTGKVQFANRKQARARARLLHDNALGAYKCTDCGWFHIGHKPQRVRNGEVDKDAWLRGGPAPREPRPEPAFTPADLARLLNRKTTA